jgi:hypothetical protein
MINAKKIPLNNAKYILKISLWFLKKSFIPVLLSIFYSILRIAVIDGTNNNVIVKSIATEAVVAKK